MAFPPNHSETLVYANRLDLDKIPVFLERSGTDPMFLEVNQLPEVLTYGKHYITVSIKLPENTPYYIREQSPLQFEAKDGEDNVIFTEIAKSNEIVDNFGGSALIYIWIKEDPLRTFKDISNGKGTLTFVGELTGEGVPEEWKDRQNYRCTFPFNINKELPNISPILFQSASLLSSSLSLSESMDFDTGGVGNYKRSFLHVSASHMETFGGKVEFIELSYSENSSNNDGEFKKIVTYPLTSSLFQSSFEVSASSGLNPISNKQKHPLPREIRREGDVTFKLRFLNKNMEYTKDIGGGKNSIFEIDNVLRISGSPVIIDSEDGIFITGSGGIHFGKDIDNTSVRLFYNIEKDSVDFERKSKDGVKKENILRIERKAEGGIIQRADDGSSLTKSSGSAILGSSKSTIEGAQASVIIGGSGGAIKQDSGSIIAGGSGHKIGPNRSGSRDSELNSILGGGTSAISSSQAAITAEYQTKYNTIIGGILNKVLTQHANDSPSSSLVSTMAAGTGTNQGNTLISSFNSRIAGSNYSVIVGGLSQEIHNGSSNIILGGNRNIISGSTGTVVIGVQGQNMEFNANTQDVSVYTADNTTYVQHLHVLGDITSSLNIIGDVSASGTGSFGRIETSIISSSIIYSSGSNIFGDSATIDTHTFNGGIVAGNITASGNISSSGDIFADDATFTGTDILLSNATAPKLRINDTSNNYGIEIEQGNGAATIRFDDGAPQDLIFDSNASNTHMVLDSGTGFTGIGGLSSANIKSTLHVGGDLKTNSHITASGNISASGTSHTIGGFTMGAIDGAIFRDLTVGRGLDIGANLSIGGKITSNITASGNISASGYVYADIYNINDVPSLDSSTTTLRLGYNTTHTRIDFGKDGTTTQLRLYGNITASGDISSSSDIVGNKLFVNGLRIQETVAGRFNMDNPVNIEGDLKTSTHITASGNISASGNLDITGNTNIDGELDVDGKTNLDDVDIDGTFDMAGATFDIDASGAITIDGVGLSIDNAGTAANITSTADASGEDFTIALAGATDSSLILSSTGTGADALQITTTAGGIDITNGGASGEDLDIIGALSAVNINSAEATTDAINIDATGGGVDIDAVGAISLDSSAGSIDINVVDGQTVKLGLNGGVEQIIAPHGTAGSELYSVINTAGTTDGSDAAGAILLSSVAGGIGLAWKDDMDLWAEGGRAVITANEDAADAIKLHADAGTSQTITVVNDAGTDNAAIGIVSTAGGITLTSANAKEIKVGTVSGAPISIGHTTSETTINDNLTVTGNSTIPKRTFSISSTTDRNLAQGDIVYIGGGSTTLGDIVYMNTAGAWASAKSNAASTSTSLLGIALGTDPDADGVLLRGTYTLDHDVGNNQGVPLYVSDVTAGHATAVIPDTSGDIVRIIGYNLGNDDEIWFNPDNTWVEIS